MTAPTPPTTAPAADPTTPVVDPATPDPAPATPAQAPQETDWKAESRKWEARAKENTAAAAKLAELEQAQMSETERLKAQLADEQKRAQDSATEALRWRIAAKHGISAEDAELLLTGADEESMTRQAERLAASASTPGAPRPDPSQGPRPTSATPGGPAKDFEGFLKDQLGH